MPRRKTNRPRKLPPQYELDTNHSHAGQGNYVVPLVKPAVKPHLRKPTGWMIKVSHSPSENVGSERPHRQNRASDPYTAAWLGVKYKKNKYEILKHFLGDNIPESAFVLTTAERKGSKEYVETTFQRQIPDGQLNSLTQEQRQDPRLHQNMGSLLSRLQYMYRVLGEANARSSYGTHLDARLDLGGVSTMLFSLMKLSTEL